MTENMKILIVDDNSDDRELCKRALIKALGKKVSIEELGSGDKCLERIENEIPSCILLDYSLPGRNGLEVLKRIRSKHTHLPVIVLTGQGNELVAVTAMKLGAQDYIVKSNITPEHLYHIIRVAIERCQLKKRIDDQQKALELFTKAMAHDLKEPIRSILSFSTLLEQGESDSERADYIQRISKAARGMEKILLSVRSFTELTDLEGIKLNDIDLNSVVEIVIGAFDKRIKETGASIKVDPLPKIHGHEAHILQLVQNLVGNALHYSGENAPDIRIFSESNEGQDIICVEDHGIGVENSQLEAIFEPFKRFSKENKNGGGLGLSICKKIVENHKGKIWCESKPKDYTKLFFSLPKAETTVKLEEKKPMVTPLEGARPAQGEDAVANILLVDDNPDDLYLTKIMLQEKGKISFNLFSANNGQEALNFIQNPTSPKIHLIILDVNMPVMDGFDFLRERQKQSHLQDIPVIMCSTSDYTKDKEVANQLGATDYIVKPLFKESFIDALSKLPNLKLTAIGNYSLLQFLPQGA